MPQLSIEGRTQRHQDDLASVARPPEVDRELLVKAACRSFELIEPWHQATSEHPFVVDIISQVQAHGDNFYTAISTSRDAAKDGHDFCQRFVDVLEYILDPTISVVELHEYINQMVTIAGQAEKNAQKVVKLFRTMRIGISNITNDVPAKVAKLKDEEQLALKKAKIGQKRARQLNMIGKGLSVAGVAAGASAVFVFPPALIVLPVVLPIMSLVAEVIENKLSKRTEKRTKQAQDCREAIKQLQRVTHDMVELENAVESFAQYWSRQEIVLNVVKGRIEELRYLKSMKLTLRTIAERWNGVANSLLDYTAKMENLLYYVPHRPAILNEQQDKALYMAKAKATTRIPRRQNTLKRSRSDDFLPDGSAPDKGSLLAPPSRTEARSKSSDSRPTDISTDPSTGIPSNERDKSPQSGSTRLSTQGTQIKPKLLGPPPDVVSRSRSSEPHATPFLDTMRASNTRRSSSHEGPRSPNVSAVPPSKGSRDGRKSLNNRMEMPTPTRLPERSTSGRRSRSSSCDDSRTRRRNSSPYASVRRVSPRRSRSRRRRSSTPRYRSRSHSSHRYSYRHRSHSNSYDRTRPRPRSPRRSPSRRGQSYDRYRSVPVRASTPRPRHSRHTGRRDSRDTSVSRRPRERPRSRSPYDPKRRRY